MRLDLAVVTSSPNWLIGAQTDTCVTSFGFAASASSAAAAQLFIGAQAKATAALQPGWPGRSSSAAVLASLLSPLPARL